MSGVLDSGYARAQALLREMGVSPADPTTASLPEARARQSRYFAFLAQDPPDVLLIQDMHIDGPHGRIPLRFYYPTAERGLPIALFIRGAGWWAGDLDSHDRTARLCALSSGLPVCSIDYRCAPEAVFPAQRDEVIAALRWLNALGAEAGVDGQKIILWGESAGASLSVLAASRLAAEGATFIKGMLLFYGNFEGPTEKTRAYSKWVWSQYLGGTWKNPDPAAIPLKARFDTLPPAWLGVGDEDPLIRDTILMEQALRNNGVACALKRYAGLPHGFVTMNRVFDGAVSAIEDAAGYARKYTGLS